MKKILALTAVLAFVVPTFGQLAEKINRIDSVLTYLHQRDLFNGTVLVGQKGKTLYKKAFGISNAETNTPLTTASPFNLASVSKQFYSMMILMLKEKGKLNLDDKVQQHLPVFPYGNITIRHLLTHTSGLPEYFDIATRQKMPLDTLDNGKMLALLAKLRPSLVFSPGEQYEYCNTNYTTLASLVEKISGTTPDRFFQQHIAGPLRMKNSFIYNLTMKSYPPDRVFGFRTEGGKHVPFDLVWLDGIVGDGNVYASVEDLYKWDQALYTEKLVKQATFREAITPHRLNNGEVSRYGFGWMISRNGEVVSHTGGWRGFNTRIVRDIKSHETLIVLDNSGNYRAADLAAAIFGGRAFQIPKTMLITRVQVIDGTGMPAVHASVRVVGARIADMGNLKPHPGEAVIDGKGYVLAPGFIDSHSHHLGGLGKSPDAIALLSQGITTIVSGQDGDSDPVDSIQAFMKARPVKVNVASYTGHGSLRTAFMNDDLHRLASATEIDSMKAMLHREMDKGSLGLSTGLEYESQFYSNRQEVIDLAKVAAAHGGRYISHIRSEDISIEEAIEEIIDIGREAKIPVQVSHIKIAMRSKWGMSLDLIRTFEQLRTMGVEITADVYPYAMWSSTPRVLFPKKDFTNLGSAEFATRELFDPSVSVLTRYSADQRYVGKTITEIGNMHHESPAAALIRVIRQTAESNGDASIVATSMSEEDIRNFIRWPNSNICSDGSMGGHPRGHGAFTRVLGRYVREQRWLTLEDAVHKMTGLTAEHIGITNRGLIARSYAADLVLFDPATVIDHATIENPTALSEGIKMVWVNGKLVYEEGKTTTEFPGVFVTRYTAD